MTDMEEPRSRVAVPAFVIATLFVLFGGYTGGFFAATKGVGRAGPQRVRVFHAEWQAHLFAPAVKIESLFVGEEVYEAW